MHEFKITIKLNDKDYCHGCPLLKTGGYCMLYAESMQHFTDYETQLTGYYRPDTCKENDNASSNN